MKKITKIILIIISVVVIVIIGGISYLSLMLPDVGAAPVMKIELTPERVARGQYLANHVTLCIDCHSTRDWSRFSGPIMEGTIGMGGERFDQKIGFPGSYISANITPFGIADYTDGELFRAITTGVNRKGKALFPMMPYYYYGRMDEEDIKAIIAYIRTLKPIEKMPEPSHSDFPMNLIVNTFPKKATFSKLPSEDNTLEYGKYMTNASGCMECHTKDDKGILIPGMEFGGGRAFPFPDGSVLRSSNLTPDKETGIGNWNADMFVAFFRSRSDSLSINTKVAPGTFNTIMPWSMYGGMKEKDLRAIFAYLQTMKPIRNTVTRFTSFREQ